MLAFIRGNLVQKGLDRAIIEASGMGYELFMSGIALSKLEDVGKEVLVHTHLQVREDGMSLFGFESLEEKTVFEKLISVSGIGPKVALAALSVFVPQDLICALRSQDVAMIQRIPGVGKKMASRMVLELKDAFGDMGDQSGMPSVAVVAPSGNKQQATEALLSLGFTEAEAKLALEGADSEASEAQLISFALKKLGA